MKQGRSQQKQSPEYLRQGQARPRGRSRSRRRPGRSRTRESRLKPRRKTTKRSCRRLSRNRSLRRRRIRQRRPRPTSQVRLRVLRLRTRRQLRIRDRRRRTKSRQANLRPAQMQELLAKSACRRLRGAAAGSMIRQSAYQHCARAIKIRDRLAGATAARWFSKRVCDRMRSVPANNTTTRGAPSCAFWHYW